MDSSTMVWHSLAENSGWKDIESGSCDFVGYHTGSRQFVENWFLAARRGSKMVAAWHQTHLEFWETRTALKDLDKDPFFKGVDLTEIERMEKGYLSQHACYKKLFDLDVDGFCQLAQGSKLYDSQSSAGPLWLNRRLLQLADF